MTPQYKRIEAEMNPPKDCVHISTRYNDFVSPAINYQEILFWKSNNCLMMLISEISYVGSARDCKKKDLPVFAAKIPLDKVQYFHMEGDVQTYTEVSGGGSTGTNVKGAVVGGLVAGQAGAVIGSRPSIEPVHTTTHTNDNREVFLVYYDENNQLRNLKIYRWDYDKLKAFIPEKEYSFVVAQAQKAPEKKDDPKERLTKLNDLLKDGLITQEEFDKKKEKILEEM